MASHRIYGLAGALKGAALAAVSTLCILGALLVRSGETPVVGASLVYYLASLKCPGEATEKFELFRCMSRDPHGTIGMAGLPPASGGMDTISTSFRKCLVLPSFVCWEQAFVAASGAVPRWFESFKKAFDSSMREIGKCQDVARSIYDFFRKIGGKPEFIGLRAKNWDYMTLDLPDGRNVAITQNGYHVVVRLGDRVYDAFTGPAGMETQLYMSSLRTPFGYLAEVIAKP